MIGKLNAPFVKAQQIYTLAPANEVWTLQSTDEIPNLLIHFDHQVRHLELQIVDAATGKPVHPVFSNYLERNFIARNGLRPPAGGPFNTDPNTDDVTAFPWDGTRMHDNGTGTPDHRKVVPDGQYKIVVKALKALGDPSNPAHWETYTIADDHHRSPVTRRSSSTDEGPAQAGPSSSRGSRLRRRARTPPQA